MPQVNTLQIDFSGGANERISPEQIGKNQYITSENIELRDNECRTRRGSFRLFPDVTGESFQGAGLFRRLSGSIPPEQFLVVQNNKLKRIVHPDSRTELATPTILDEEFLFVQAIDNMYMFRGENNDVFKWDGDPDSTVGFPTVPTLPGLVGMPGSDVAIYEYDRFWVVTEDDNLFISDLLSEAFDPNNSFLINKGKDGEKIIALFPFPGGNLLVFKERSIALLQNANGDLTGLTLDFVDNEYGCISRDAVVAIGQDVWFLSSQGIMSVTLTVQQKHQLIDVPISSNIPDTMDRINFLRAGNAQTTLFDNHVLFAVPIDNAEENNAIIVYDLLKRTFLPLWTGHNVRRFIKSTVQNQDRLYYVNDLGGLVQLFSGIHKDFDHSNNRHLVMVKTSDSQYIDMTSVLTGADEIATQATGRISLRIRITDDTADGNIFILFDDTTTNDYLRIYLESKLIKAELKDGGTVQWAFNLANYPTDAFFHLTLVQDGTKPNMFVENTINTKTFTDSTDLTKWITDIVKNRVRAFSNATSGGTLIAPAANIIGDLDLITFTGVTGFDDIKANWQLNEGSGTTVTENTNSKTATFSAAPNDPIWSTAFPAPLDIIFSLNTRAYNFDAPMSPKSLSQSEFAIRHRNPKITIDLFTDQVFQKKNLFTDRVYDELKYMIHNKADWVNTNVNDDHDDPFRENYAPLTIPAAGVTLFADGITLGKEQEHVEFFYAVCVSQRFRFEIVNKTGTISIKALTLTARRKTFAGKESMAL